MPARNLAIIFSPMAALLDAAPTLNNASDRFPFRSTSLWHSTQYDWTTAVKVSAGMLARRGDVCATVWLPIASNTTTVVAATASFMIDLPAGTLIRPDPGCKLLAARSLCKKEQPVTGRQ
jgi:hypothetical protein